MEAVDKSSVFFQFLPERDQHDFTVVAGTRFGERNGIFESFQVSFFVNSTKIPFVLPNCGIYPFGLKGCVYIALPVSSDLIFALCRVQEGNAVGMINRGRLENEELVKQLNLQALRQQIIMSNGGRIICSEREELERLRQMKNT